MTNAATGELEDRTPTTIILDERYAEILIAEVEGLRESNWTAVEATSLLRQEMRKLTDAVAGGFATSEQQNAKAAGVETDGEFDFGEPVP